MTPPKTHNEMRGSVCAVCLKPGCGRQVNNTILHKIRNYVYSGFHIECISLPCGLCNSCRLIISNETTGMEALPKINYDELKHSVTRIPEGIDSKCTCYICEAGRSKTFKRKSKKSGPKTPTYSSKSPTLTLCTNCF